MKIALNPSFHVDYKRVIFRKMTKVMLSFKIKGNSYFFRYLINIYFYFGKVYKTAIFNFAITGKFKIVSKPSQLARCKNKNEVISLEMPEFVINEYIFFGGLFACCI
jgi:hypothetical protein